LATAPKQAIARENGIILKTKLDKKFLVFIPKAQQIKYPVDIKRTIIL